MTNTSFAQLTDSELREAWQDEARDFTPWLVDNIDYLSNALDLDLEPTETEASVEQYWADIVATEAKSGVRVLIENQLENSDHKHLGQILTYLAGLEARIVIWIARNFSEAHLSAIRWLNKNTTDDFAFFAARLRVVRIGDSPFAPIFEVVEKPNTWERNLGRTADQAEAERSNLRGEFWNRYLELHPGLFKPSRTSNVWVPMVPDESVFLSMYVGSSTSGMFLRGPYGTDGKNLAEFIARHEGILDDAFGKSEATKTGYYYGIWIDITLQEKQHWDKLIDWMEEKRCHYQEILNSIWIQENN